MNFPRLANPVIVLLPLLALVLVHVRPTNHFSLATIAGAVFVSPVDIIKCFTNVSILSRRLSLITCPARLALIRTVWDDMKGHPWKRTVSFVLVP